MRHYTGERLSDGAVRVLVWEESPGVRLPAPRPLRQESADVGGGVAVLFDWGEASAGAMSLSRALLADCVPTEKALDALSATFEYAVLRGLGENDWNLGEADIRAFVQLAPLLVQARTLELWRLTAEHPTDGRPVVGLASGVLVDEIIRYQTRA